MAARSPRIPPYRLHKASGQAVVTISSRDVNLGLHGTAASRARYDQVIATWLESGRVEKPVEAGPTYH